MHSQINFLTFAENRMSVAFLVLSSETFGQTDTQTNILILLIYSKTRATPVARYRLQQITRPAMPSETHSGFAVVVLASLVQMRECPDSEIRDFGSERNMLGYTRHMWVHSPHFARTCHKVSN